MSDLRAEIEREVRVALSMHNRPLYADEPVPMSMEERLIRLILEHRALEAEACCAWGLAIKSHQDEARRLRELKDVR